MTLIAFDPYATIPSLLTGGVGSVDRVLVNGQSSAQRSAATRIADIFNKRVVAGRQALAESTSTPITERLLREQSLLIGRKDRLNEAVGVLSKAITQIGYLEGHITYLREQITELEASNLTAAEFSTIWDNKMRKINELAAAAQDDYVDGGNYYKKNLIDSQSRTSYGTQTLYAPYNSYGDTLEITGTYLGTDYYITDVDGEYWYSDNGFRLNDEATASISEYTTHPTAPTGTTTDLGNMSLTSYVSDSDITFDADATTGIPGTITRGGLRLVDSFLYEDFGNQTAIDRAKDDLDAAESKLLLAGASYQSDRATLQSRASLFDAQILGISNEVISIIQELQEEKDAELLATELEFAIAQFDFALLASRGNRLVSTLMLGQDAVTATDTRASGDAITGAVVSLSA